MKLFLGIDVGGTEIKGATIDKFGNIVYNYKCMTGASLGFSQVKQNLWTVLDNLLESANGDVCAIGIGSAGTIDSRSGKVLFATKNLPNWTGFEIKKEVEEKTKIFTTCENDANAALYGEMFIGAAKGLKSVVMITLGTGVGGAVAIDGKIFHGASFCAGRIGHTILYPKGKICNCGQLGCVEQYLSGSAFTQGARKLCSSIKHGSEVFDLLELYGDHDLKKYIANYFSDLATLMYTIKNFFDPEAIIIGGGLINSKKLWWDKYFLPNIRELKVQVLPAELKNMAGIIGAGKLAMDELCLN